MADNNRLWAIGEPPEHGDTALELTSPIDDPAGDPADPVETWHEADVYEEAAPHRSATAWLLPALAVVTVIAWSAFFGWAHRDLLLGGAPAVEWSRMIVDWSVPVLLVVALWLLAMRNSRREAARFGLAAQALSSESKQLEQRLTGVNRELSLARDFIAAQSRDLEALGRVAVERLSLNADRLQGLIRDNEAQVEQIGRVSSSALANMDRLRDDLPVISNSARDMTSQIGHAGEVARAQLDELITGFDRLTGSGEASGHQVVALRGKVEQAIGAFEAQAEKLETVLGHRFAALTDRSAAFRADLDGREVEAFAAMRRRADSLDRELAARADQLTAAEQDALAALSERSAALRAELDNREAEALAAMRARAELLAQQVTTNADELARLEHQAAMALAERMAQINGEALKLSAQLRESELDAGQRWAGGIVELEQRMAEAVARITEIDANAMAHARDRLMALRDEAGRVDATMTERLAAFDAQRAQRDASADEREAMALAALEQRLAEFDAQVSERQQEQLAHVAGLAERSDALSARLRELSGAMDELVVQGHETQGDLAQATAGFAARVAESRESLSESGAMVARLTNDSVRLLELIRSSADHTLGDLPRAIGQAETRLSAFEHQARTLHTVIAEAGERGEALAGHVATARGDGAATLDDLAALQVRLHDVAQQSEGLAAHARGELAAAVASLEDASRNALGQLQDTQADAIRGIAERIGADSSAAIARALREHAIQAVAELEEAAHQAGEAGRQTAIELREQVAQVDELAGNLEQRVAAARQQAQEQVDNDFARRMALITESLNSNSIDISKAFANEVTDTAWASYLRGDRGIFTRRAVRLLDNQDARAVADTYERDSDFRETVNRYIHDFEAMLRTVLSTRDGHALAVTLLSSDMGKLYVALAQAIDRLR